MNDRKPTTGYYFKLNGRRAALSWDVKKQAAIALSSSEAEYKGMAAAVQKALFLKQLLEDFDIQQKHPIAILKATNSSSTDVVQHSAGVSRSRPQLLFLHQKQNIRAWQQQFKKHFF